MILNEHWFRTDYVTEHTINQNRLWIGTGNNVICKKSSDFWSKEKFYHLLVAKSHVEVLNTDIPAFSACVVLFGQLAIELLTGCGRLQNTENRQQNSEKIMSNAWTPESNLFWTQHNPNRYQRIFTLMPLAFLALEKKTSIFKDLWELYYDVATHGAELTRGIESCNMRLSCFSRIFCSAFSSLRWSTCWKQLMFQRFHQSLLGLDPTSSRDQGRWHGMLPWLILVLWILTQWLTES